MVIRRSAAARRRLATIVRAAIVLAVTVRTATVAIAAAHPSSATAPPALATVPPHELTPVDAIETARLMENPPTLANSVDSAMTSPDGRRYVIRVAHGDVAHNGVWLDLLTGRLDSLDAAAHPRACAHLLSTGLGSNRNNEGADYDTQPSNILRWRDNRRVAFLWSDRRQVRQVVSVDLVTCKASFLTHSPTHVFSFAFGAQGTMLFNAQNPHPASRSKRLWAHGFTVGEAADGWSILRGDIDGGNIFTTDYDNQWFIRSAAGVLHRIDLGEGPIDRTGPTYRPILVDPRGRFALTTTGLASVPENWSRYDPSLQSSLELNKAIPHRIPLSYALIDLHDGTSRPLWDAPSGFRSQVAWSPRDPTVLLAPTFLPVAANDAIGLAGAAAAIVDVRTGQYQSLPIDLTSRTVATLVWTSPTRIAIRSTDSSGAHARTEQFNRVDSHWELDSLADSAISGISDDSSNSASSAQTAHRSIGTPPRRGLIRMETRQTLNHPPQLFAVDIANGVSRLALDPNPRLTQRFKLGRVERLSGTLPNGKSWLGQLIYPVDYVGGRQFPLLIQSLYGKPWGDEEYSLDGSWRTGGMGLGPTLYASYPGQLLATRNIAVLELEVLHPSDGVQEAEDYQLAYETLAEQLSASGLADRQKIALAGFSRNGYWVEFTLAHSEFPFAAAIAADNWDPSYFQAVLANWRDDYAEANGAPAFGAGLQQWLAHAPGFNAEHIHTPLLMIGQSAGLPVVISKWEIYSRLRHLHQPVDMYIMPRADTHPSHTPQNPQQIIAVQNQAIDWLSFWLTGCEDPQPEKREQYARWRRFRDSRAIPQPQL